MGGQTGTPLRLDRGSGRLQVGDADGAAPKPPKEVAHNWGFHRGSEPLRRIWRALAAGNNAGPPRRSPRPPGDRGNPPPDRSQLWHKVCGWEWCDYSAHGHGHVGPKVWVAGFAATHTSVSGGRHCECEGPVAHGPPHPLLLQLFFPSAIWRRCGRIERGRGFEASQPDTLVRARCSLWLFASCFVVPMLGRTRPPPSNLASIHHAPKSLNKMVYKGKRPYGA